MANIIVGAFCTLVYILFLILSIPIYIYRLVCIFITKLFRPDISEILNPLSCKFAADLTTGKPPRSTIVINILINNRFPLSTLRTLIIKNWIQAKDSSGKITYEKFQQFPFEWLGFTWWKWAEFNIDNHILEHENLGSSIVSEKEIDNLTEFLIDAPFKPCQSPWEIRLVHNYRNKELCPESESMTVALIKVHHSLADGYSMLTALVEGLFEQPVMKLPMPRYSQRSLLERIRFLVSFPFNAIYELCTSFSSAFDSCPWRIPNEKKSWKHLYTKSDLIRIQVIKDIKNAAGVSFTSVLLSAISAGISENMTERKMKSQQTVDSMHFLSTLPVPDHSKILTNQVAFALFDIPTKEFSSPLNRLRKCDSLLESTKLSVVPLLTSLYKYGVGCHLAPVVKLIMSNNNMVSVGLTNFPGMPIQVSRGHDVGVAVHFCAGCLSGNMGVGFMVLSYGDYIRLAFTAEEALLSRDDMEAIKNRFTNEIYSLHDTLTGTKFVY